MTTATGFGKYKVAITYQDAKDFTTTVSSVEQIVAKVDNGKGSVAAITAQRSTAFNEGVTLKAGEISGDPDGAARVAGYQWYLNNNPIFGATTDTLLTTATGYGQYKVEITYQDAQDFTAIVASAEQLAGNRGQARFGVEGITQTGQALQVRLDMVDPDGNGDATHTWQSSSEGQTWQDQAGGQRFVLAKAQEGQLVRLVSTYTDREGYLERVITPLDSRITAPRDPVTAWRLDLDGNGTFTSTDALLSQRLMLGTYPGSALLTHVSGLQDHQAIRDRARTGWSASSNIPAPLDVDGDGLISPLTDGLAIGLFLAGHALSASDFQPLIGVASRRSPFEVLGVLQDLAGFQAL